jgi:rRNA maturation RNase YbeY
LNIPFPATGNEDTGVAFDVETGGKPLSESEEVRITDWVKTIIDARGGQLGQLSYILCDDNYLHQINLEYLNHDTLTDIITFPLQDFPIVGGDIFISTQRVMENAKELGVPYEQELKRVIIHGVLHLSGQGDKTAEEAREMRKLEEWALSMDKS